MMLGSTIIDLPLSVESFFPKDLGLQQYKEVERIFSGDCGSQDNHYNKDWQFTPFGGAHTHICPYDPLYNCICVSDINELLDDKAIPSTLFMHEYAHVLRGLPEIYIKYNFRCVGPQNLHSWEVPMGATPLNKFEPHDKEWEEIMRSLGQDPYLWVTPSKMSKYSQAAAMIK